MIRLAHPWFLLFLIPLIFIFLRGGRSGGRIRFSSVATIKLLIKRHRFHPRQMLLLLRFLALALLIVALSRPQAGKKFTEVKSEGVDIILLLDTSGSMKALDFVEEGERVDRLTVVKKVVSEFVKKRAADRMGLVVFGEDAYTQCPLTLDHGILIDFLEKTEIGMAGDATSIGDALAIGVKRMKDLKAKSKILILLTDGRNTAGEIHPLKAAELAKAFDLKVYTIGVGTNGKAPFLVDTIFGKRYVYQDVDIDEDTLKKIAEATGGLYYRATDTESLKKIYNEIDSLEKTEIRSKEYTEYNEMFHSFLIWGIFLLLIEIFLSQTRLRKIP